MNNSEQIKLPKNQYVVSLSPEWIILQTHPGCILYFQRVFSLQIYEVGVH